MCTSILHFYTTHLHTQSTLSGSVEWNPFVTIVAAYPILNSGRPLLATYTTEVYFFAIVPRLNRLLGSTLRFSCFSSSSSSVINQVKLYQSQSFIFIKEHIFLKGSQDKKLGHFFNSVWTVRENHCVPGFPETWSLSVYTPPPMPTKTDLVPWWTFAGSIWFYVKVPFHWHCVNAEYLLTVQLFFMDFMDFIDECECEGAYALS